ncbi:type III polyketide synthase [Cryobacterium levicorallinum]|uniref:Predicted naringenin-chalcone synthase n=1 Tax=Cryobacterium levicorallinum TaxID=995038 RepID=A0A1I2ZN97_9MICO|nr:type III polyketide synthase [Cryobacterium levicorallinum]TFB89598.1 type III polyketide synthase [Cryobacterium levicorallinum]GEP25944.1 naringenin-chalcone synthase [Cryobacterium levicorallinum]SFH39342.1 Predicted naringenin-chalcone synthase [Cryobacterium levicorallinum]
MAVTLRALQTVVPPTILIQEQVRDIFAAQPGLSRLAQRLVSTSFNVSGIETRHTVIAELTLDNDSTEPQFFDAHKQLLLMPSTRVRNELYIEEATKLFVEAGRRALAACPDIRPEDITHVVTVSCTGFYAPGPDYMLVRELGLNASTQRYHLGFMGCYAAMPALRIAKQFVEADPNAVVLVVSAELCSLHLRTSSDPDTIVASSLFSDGAAAGIVSARAPLAGEKALGLDLFETVITPVGEGDMAWKIGDEGFEMILSTYVPHIIDEHIEGALAPLFARDVSITGQLAATASLEADAVGSTLGAAVLTLAPPASLSSVIEHWAIHPGGRSILDKTEAKLELRPDQLLPSRQTLRTNGNMSSATILFVMKAILDGPATADGERVCAMAFGPGLTVESGLMTVTEG